MHFIEFPSSFLICGPSQSGKSVLVTKLIKKYCSQFTKVIWCNSETNAISEDVRSIPNIEVYEQFPDNFNAIPDGSAIVLDDGMIECDTKAVCDLFVKGCHHKRYDSL